jgi:arylsulfatase A-like enzyme
MTGVFLALAFGFSEVLAMVFMRHGLDRLLWLTDDLGWMIPLSYMILFAGPTVLFSIVATRWPAFAHRATVGLLGFAGFFSLVFLIPWLHIIAIVILAAGLAVAVTRWSTDHRDRFMRVAIPATAVLAVLVLGLAVWRTVGERMTERRAIANLPEATRGAPNVLMIILDTVRASRMGLYGYPRETSPNLNALAQRAITFDWAVATSPTSLPSHASMLTGRYPDEMDAGWLTPLSDRYPTLPEQLQIRGYATAAFSGNLFYLTRETGLDRGFLHFADHPRTLRRLITTSSLGQAIVRVQMIVRLGRTAAQQVMQVRRISQPKTANDVDNEFWDWIDRRDGDHPYFAVLNYLDAHAPYEPPQELRSAFVRPCIRGLQTQEQCVLQVRSDRYDATIANVDRHVGRMLDSLQARGTLDNTIVIVTSDHGELLGEHGLFGHGNSLYFEVLHVPLLIAIPGGPAGRVTRPVSLRDLPSTILDLVGAEPSGFPGTPWRPLWASSELPPADTLMAFVKRGINKPDHEPVAHGDLYSLTAWPFHYVSNTDGSTQLFDVSERPGRRADRGSQTEFEDVMTVFRQAVERRQREVHDPNR